MPSLYRSQLVPSAQNSTGTSSEPKRSTPWAVSDDGNLDTVESVMELDGDEKDSETSDVSGSEAEGEHELRERDGYDETYDVTLTVTDTDDNETSDTKTITLG